MNIQVSINNTTKAAFDEKLVRKAARTVANGEEKLIGPASRVELSVAFISPVRIRQLNKMYRKRDVVTDVLSFAGDEDGECDCGCGCEHAAGPLYLGELAVCLAQVKKDARESKVAADYELAWVIVHGILHLMGYDHEAGDAAAEIMRAKEKFYLSKLK
jgi:probable rRNA maturation factor